VLDYVDRNQRKRGLASASLKSGSMAASGPVRDEPDPWPCVGSTGHGRITAKSTRMTRSCHQNARWKGSACSITSICLEREEGAEPQKHDGSWNDRAGGLTNSAGNCGQAGWEKHSCKATEDGKPAKDGHKHRPFLRPAIVSAHNGKSCDEQEDAGHEMSAGSRETCSANSGNEPMFSSIPAAIATSVGPIRPAIVFEVVI
jgi:hypothetical protein